MTSLLVNEVYGPVKQGEGKSAGKEVGFLRLSGCNLACVWCDTPYTWNWIGTSFIHPDKFDKSLEAHKMKIGAVLEEIANKFSEVKALVVSGGEPVLQQSKLIELFHQLPFWWIEVETNGTIVIKDEFADLVNQFNCSPKTSNSGPDNPLKLRYKPEAIKKIASLGKKATFKFVIQNDTDLDEMKTIISECGIRTDQVWLMPEGRTREEQELRQQQVKDLSKALGYNFSPRLHILEFGNKRAV